MIWIQVQKEKNEILPFLSTILMRCTEQYFWVFERYLLSTLSFPDANEFGGKMIGMLIMYRHLVVTQVIKLANKGVVFSNSVVQAHFI